jgi:F420-dependent oxidoreductase-like protein
MDHRIFIEPQQGTSYDAVMKLAQAADRLGFNGFFTSDHYLRMGDAQGLPGPLDAWTTLAGLARDTTDVRLGTLVTPATFRHPGSFAIQVAQVDHMSAGRVEIGLGAGWYDAEHHATGIPFPELGERFDMLEDTAAILTGMWETPTGELFDYEGAAHTIVGSPALPKPLQQPRPPIIVGGGGPNRTPRLAAKVGSEFNLSFAPVDAWIGFVENVRSVCEAEGRDPNELVYSSGQVVCVGRTEDEFHARASAIGREPDELRESGIAGLPDEAAAKLQAFADAGCQRIYHQYLDIDDLDHIEVLAEVVG